MCIFSQPVESVTETRIFARKPDSQRQFVAYQMKYESAGENAMILPVPVRQPASETSLRFIDLHDYQDLFDDLERGFPDLSPPGLLLRSDAMVDSRMTLEVFKVGNYVASFVPTLADFQRLDPLFTLPFDTWKKIPRYSSFGFAVFQLASGSLQPHPMAFEFESESEAIFFPTMHIHDGAVHPTEGFDHVLYTQDAGFDRLAGSYLNSKRADRSTGLIRSRFTAGKFCDVSRTRGIVDPDLLVHRQFIRGEHENRDVEIVVGKESAGFTPGFLSTGVIAPCLLGAAAAGWFFARRSKIMGRDGSGQATPADED